MNLQKLIVGEYMSCSIYPLVLMVRSDNAKAVYGAKHPNGEFSVITDRQPLLPPPSAAALVRARLIVYTHPGRWNHWTLLAVSVPCDSDERALRELNKGLEENIYHITCKS